MNRARTLGGRTRQDGSMLIVALAVLTLLSIIAVTFAALMRLERKATENFSNWTKVSQLGGSADSRVIAMLRGGLYWSGYTQHNKLRSPWIYGITGPRGEQMLGGRMPLDTAEPEDVSVTGDLGSSYMGGIDRYKVKVIDCASQININSRQDTLAGMLDNLGEALERDEDYGKNPFFSEYPMAGNQIKGGDIIRFRNKLEGNRFHSKSQLRAVIGAKNYALVADFITTQGWEDHSTYRGSDGREQYNNPFGGTGSNTGTQQLNDDLNAVGTAVVGSSPKVGAERRYPININTAPEPVLVAVLTGLSGRRAFLYTELTTQLIEERNRGEIDLESGTLPPGSEELTLRQFPVWVYTQPLSINDAQRIAQLIVGRRKVQPFTQWTTGNAQISGGFNEFVNRELVDNFFPAPSTITVVAPHDPKNNRYKNELLNPSTPSGRMYVKGHAQGEASIRRQQGLPYSAQNAFYYELIRGVLLANANPNTRVNRYNPNAPAYSAVDKSNLIKLGLDGNDPILPTPGHTTDFCFDTNGYFEITTLAEMKGPGYDNEASAATTYAEVKRRSIVKVWETLRHTTQQDFEEPFQSAGYSSQKDRTYVTTYPDPIHALEPDVYFGSNLDGRVELTGYIDALRESLPSASRQDFFKGRQNVLLHHGMKYRSDASRQQVRSLAKSARGGVGFTNELAKFLDPTYSRSGQNFRKRYSAANWGGLNDSSETDKQINEPLVDEVSRGSDVMPDGLSSSNFRSSNLGARLLRFPASRYRTNPGDEGALNRTYRNEIGNLAYYNGGVAFWLKLEVDGDDPIFCGLVGGTQVQTKVGFGPTDSEGTQFYVWKNTQGQLRVSRLYYHQAFVTNSTQRAVPLIGDEEEQEGESEEELTDPRKRWARTDVLVDATKWRAHEWHHVAVEWNDELGGNRVRVLVDFEDTDAISHNLGESKFCALNVEDPKDGLFVGGFFRDQAVASEGLFKFGTNLDRKTVLTEPSVKRVLSNGTIDEFVTFTGTYSPPYGSIGYFTDKQGVYTNRFRIPLPNGIQRLRLRSLAWSLYPPAMYHGAPVTWRRETDFEATVANVGQGGQSRLPVNDAGGEGQENSNISGRWLYATSTLGGRVGEMVYQFRMRAALGSGKYGSNTVASPVLDDVTLTYYLPTAQILLSETY